MSLRTEFLDGRRKGLGGSDIGAILGVSTFKSAVDVFLDKTQPRQEEAHNELFYWGHALEPIIIDRFERDNDAAVLRELPVKAHPDYEWMLANIDGKIVPQEKPHGILECKTVSAFGSKEWGIEDTDQVPLSYLAQVVWYMAVYDLDYAVIAALIGGNQFRQYRVERDGDMEKTLIDAGNRFWHDHVLAGVAPEIKSKSDALRLYAKDDGSAVDVGDDVYTAYLDLKTLKGESKDLELKIEQKELALIRAVGEASQINYNGAPLATWKHQQRKTIDAKALTAKHPAIAEQFQRVTDMRVLRLK